MHNTKNLILENIRNQVSYENLICDSKVVTEVNNIEFNVVTGLKDKSVSQIERDTIFYEDINGVRIVIAEFECRITMKENQNDFAETVSKGSFRGEYDTETNSLKENTCAVFLRKK